MLYSYKNQEPTHLPHRIILSSGLSRTDVTTFTPEEIADAGYVEITQDKPNATRYQNINWSGSEWVISDMTDEEKGKVNSKQLESIRIMRDGQIQKAEWRVTRYYSEVRQGLTPTDDIAQIDAYMQALRDITKQEDMFNVVWPTITLSILESTTTS